ncbi:hypothetical protein ZIOFF_070623 [Zingiber officinale]|uniref:NAD(P)-binding domain-containing protein n=1 Tax=Zingiber officinale TaxID=94328 RepID=A0A8J5C2Q5_ZINOF|nr:hypothetical protein ZIOFF_070623 [Zingiber officinale]
MNIMLALTLDLIVRSGRPSIRESWADKVEWYRGNLLEPESLKDAMNNANAVVSCVGGFGSPSHMRTLNGTANVNAVRVASEQGVQRFAYVSAASFGVIDYFLQGYYDGQKATEAEISAKFPNAVTILSLHQSSLSINAHNIAIKIFNLLLLLFAGVILRPGYIYGTKRYGSIKIPLGLIFAPFELVLQYTEPLHRIPLIGPVFTPPVNVAKVAKVIVRGATDPAFSPAEVDVYSIIRLGKQL